MAPRTAVQERINAIVRFSLAFYLFQHLSRLYHQQEYRYQKNDNFDRDLRLLRDLGYLEYFRIADLRDGDDLTGKVKLTPLGRMLVELREAK